MQIIPANTNIDFIGKRKIGYAISAALILIALLSVFALYGIRWGIDFTGGIEVQARFGTDISINDVRQAVASIDSGVSVQSLGGDDDREFLVRLPSRATDAESNAAAELVRDTLVQALAAGQPDIRRIEVVGPQVGGELRHQGVMAVLFALIGILIYVAIRFEMRYALGAIAATVHDIIVVVGLFSLAGLEFSLPTIAALLTIIGYSLNDTIIIYDRIRETRGKGGKRVAEQINRALNDTLSRTVLTSGTTMITVLCLLLFTQTGTVIHDFAFALFAGILVGTFSSLYIAAPLLLVELRRRA